MRLHASLFQLHSWGGGGERVPYTHERHGNGPVCSWRRSLRVNWRASFPRIDWDLHSAFGFLCFSFVLLWGISGFYFAFPQAFSIFFVLDPADRITDQWLFWLSELQFGRFPRLTESLWAVFGLVPGILAFTGTLICCRRVIYKNPSNPYR